MIYRYSRRHLLLSSFGVQGQSNLSKSSILVVGAGGLGAPALLYLAASGAGYPHRSVYRSAKFKSAGAACRATECHPRLSVDAAKKLQGDFFEIKRLDFKLIYLKKLLKLRETPLVHASDKDIRSAKYVLEHGADADIESDLGFRNSGGKAKEEVQPTIVAKESLFTRATKPTRRDPT